MSIAGKIAIVTGAAHGIGEATAQVLSEQGATVAIVDIDLATAQQVVAKINASGRKAKAYDCDVSKPTAVEQLAKDVVSDLGSVDILVNNAGICPRISIAPLK